MVLTDDEEYAEEEEDEEEGEESAPTKTRHKRAASKRAAARARGSARVPSYSLSRTLKNLGSDANTPFLKAHLLGLLILLRLIV